MAKSKSVYMCRECGYTTAKWMGRCPACQAWNTMAEQVVTTKKEGRTYSGEAVVKQLSQVVTENENRIKTGSSEFDRVLGGGLSVGSLVLVGGDPGIGKSTLILQTAAHFSEHHKVLYVSGEESETQIKLRADRIHVCGNDIMFLCHTDMDEIISCAKNKQAEILIIDSIQTMETANASGTAGSVSQVRECCMTLMEYAKKNNVSVIMIGHVTKDGNIAGPRILEHMVDSVLYFEGERVRTYRMLRTVKNRFGSTNEVGVFEMTSEGLADVENPSAMLMYGRRADAPGSSVLCTVEGTRAIIAEIQALAVESGFAAPRRAVTGADYNRTVMLLAVAEKHLRVNLQKCDIYINIAGGMRVTEPAADLPIIISVLSAVKNMPVKDGLAAMGEVGLTGELRYIGNAEKRIAELSKMGFKKCLLPAACNNVKNMGLELIFIDNLDELRSLGGEIFEKPCR